MLSAVASGHSKAEERGHEEWIPRGTHGDDQHWEISEIDDTSVRP
jgi:hypothetical protein